MGRMRRGQVAPCPDNLGYAILSDCLGGTLPVREHKTANGRGIVAGRKQNQATKGKAKTAARPARAAPARKKRAAAGANKRKAGGRKAYRPKPNEKYMNPKQVRYFHELLTQRRRELLEEVDRTVHHLQGEATQFPDPTDRASQEEEFALELRTRDRERQLIYKIDEAIRELGNGEYGYCRECGAEIGLHRLEARPMATLCIDCKRLDEIRERQYK